MSVLEKLTEGIVERSLNRDGAALLEKWERTGLLEGLNEDLTKVVWQFFLKTKLDS